MAEAMRAGDAINVAVFNLDGTRRRWWRSTIDEVTALAESWVSYGHPEELSPPATRDETFDGKSRRLGVRSAMRVDAKNRGAHVTVRNLRPVE